MRINAWGCAIRSTVEAGYGNLFTQTFAPCGLLTMNENDATRKSFNQLGFGAAELPPLLGGLMEGKQLLPPMTAEDLREMSKFNELPNVAGLAAHRVLRPAPEGLDPGGTEAPEGEPAPRIPSPTPELPGGVYPALSAALIHTPSLVLHGALAGRGGRPFGVGVIVPLAQGAHLAQALARMLWEPAEGGRRLEYVLFVWPEVLRRKDGAVIAAGLMGHWPDQRTGVLLGYDDPALAARMMLDAARRRWEGEGCRLIGAPEGGAEEAREDLLLEESGRETAVWANPLLAAAALARSAEGRRAALAVGALPLGVEVDAEGHFPLFEGATPAAGSPAGWVVVPRVALPAAQ